MTILTPQLGFGDSPFGGSIYSFGDPALAAPPNNRPMENANQNKSLDARLIDTNTRDYVINADGNTAGMTSISQQVFLAMATTLGTAAVITIGNTIRQMKVLGDNYKSQVTGITQQALSGLVSAGYISIVNITVTPLSYMGTLTGATVNVWWMDNKTNTLEQSKTNITGS